MSRREIVDVRTGHDRAVEDTFFTILLLIFFPIAVPLSPVILLFMGMFFGDRITKGVTWSIFVGVVTWLAIAHPGVFRKTVIKCPRDKMGTSCVIYKHQKRIELRQQRLEAERASQ